MALSHPQEADKDFTNRMIKVGKLLKIPMVDHLIITETLYYGFADAWLIQAPAKSSACEVTKKESEEIKMVGRCAAEEGC